jgi:hypothetical protein
MGYIPMVLGDFTSQVILNTYIIYIFLSKCLSHLLNFSVKYALYTNQQTKLLGFGNTDSFKDQNLNLHHFFSKIGNNQLVIDSIVLSKNLSSVSANLYHVDRVLTPLLALIKSDKNILSGINPNLTYVTVRKKNNKTCDMVSNLTLDEAFYTGSLSINTVYKINNTSINLNDIYRLLRLRKNPSTFSFNIENNLNMAKQQRWLVKNSLLTESIINNSFLITQSKKLIGSGFLDKNYTNKTL